MMPLARLHLILSSLGRVSIAVSGGVDSLTLATVAHRLLGDDATMHHAISPAVPAEATARTRRLAQAEGWTLDIFDAGEFDDPAYRANPVNRCFFCKTHLYGAVAARTTRTILSGTNLDDLGDYRPGLRAAERYHVRHPFVEARIDKDTLRSIALDLGLGVLAELPSAPCLSSRIETGIRIEPSMLAMVHAAETLVTAVLSPRTVRCRVRSSGVVVELDRPTLDALDDDCEAELRTRLSELGGPDTISSIRFEPYRTGSAFLHTATKATLS